MSFCVIWNIYNFIISVQTLSLYLEKIMMTSVTRLTTITVIYLDINKFEVQWSDGICSHRIQVTADSPVRLFNSRGLFFQSQLISYCVCVVLGIQDVFSVVFLIIARHTQCFVIVAASRHCTYTKLQYNFSCLI